MHKTLSMFDVIASRQFPHDLVEARTKSCNPWHFSSSFDECPPFCIVNCAYKMNTLNDGRKMESASLNGCHKSNIKKNVQCWDTMHVPSSMFAMFVFLLCVRRKIIGEQLIFTIEQEQKGVKKKIVSDRSRPEMNSLLRIVSTIGDVRICFCLHFSSRQVTVIADRTDGSCCCSNKTHSHIFRGTAAYTFSPSPQYPCIDSCKTL